MEVSLVKATDNDAQSILNNQIKTFKPLLNKYKDYDINPANETVVRVKERINRTDGIFYKILADHKIVGAIGLFWKENLQFWISPLFILPSYQGKGIAQKAVILVEKMYPQAISWELATLKEEKRNCYFYEKMGYEQTGVSKKINNKATLIFYKKYC